MSKVKTEWRITDRYIDPYDPRDNTLRHELFVDGEATGAGIVKIGLDRWEYYIDENFDPTYADNDHWRSARKQCEEEWQASQEQRDDDG